MVLGLVAATAAPASATGDWELTAGEIEVTTAIGFPVLEFDLANPDEDECNEPVPPADIDVQFDDPSMGDVSATLASKGRFEAFGTWYQADITGTGSGTYSGASSPFTVTLQMDFDVDFYEITPPTCEKTAVVCHWDVDDADLSGSYTGSIPSPGSGDTAVLDTTSPADIDVGTCSDGLLDLFDGGDVEVTGLTAVFK